MKLSLWMNNPNSNELFVCDTSRVVVRFNLETIEVMQGSENKWKTYKNKPEIISTIKMFKSMKEYFEKSINDSENENTLTAHSDAYTRLWSGKVFSVD